jgi:hypothetical protein
MNIAFDFGITNTDVVVDYNSKKNSSHSLLKKSIAVLLKRYSNQ